MVSLLVLPLVSQFKNFILELPSHLDNLTQTFSGVEYYFQSRGIEFSSQEFFKNLGIWLTESSGKIFSTTASIFNGFISIIAILSLTFYLSVKEEGMKNFLTSVTPAIHQNYAVSLAERIRERIGKWLQWQLFLMFIIFALDYAALYFLGVPYSVILAMFAGVLEIIP